MAASNRSAHVRRWLLPCAARSGTYAREECAGETATKDNYFLVLSAGDLFGGLAGAFADEPLDSAVAFAASFFASLAGAAFPGGAFSGGAAAGFSGGRPWR